MDKLKISRFLFQRRLHNKGHLNLTTEVPKGFSPGVFNRLWRTEEWLENILFKVIYGKRSIFNFIR